MLIQASQQLYNDYAKAFEWWYSGRRFPTRNDRVLTLTFTARNELGDQTKLDLIVEIMARHSNIILVDQASGK